MPQKLIIRKLKASEMHLIIDRAKAEGWNPGIEDYIAFYQADPDGFFVGEIDDKPRAFISLVAYPNQYAFLGLYIVDPMYRGRGYGMTIWNYALAQREGYCIGLDGVVAQIDNYKKSGFELAFMQMRWGCKAIQSASYEMVKTASNTHFNQIETYDQSVFGFARKSFLYSWMRMHNARCFFTESDGIVTGYAIIRACHEGYKIGPLFADKPEDAHQLFLACHNSASNDAMVYIDMPEIQPEMQEFVNRYGLECQFKTARMYKNGSIQWDTDRIYGVTTFELG